MAMGRKEMVALCGSLSVLGLVIGVTVATGNETSIDVGANRPNIPDRIPYEANGSDYIGQVSRNTDCLS